MAPTLFHYPGVILELSEALRHIVNASDWREGAGIAADVSALDRLRQEHGNVAVARTHALNVYRTLIDREDALRTDLLLAQPPPPALSPPPSPPDAVGI